MTRSECAACFHECVNSREPPFNVNFPGNSCDTRFFLSIVANGSREKKTRMRYRRDKRDERGWDGTANLILVSGRTGERKGRENAENRGIGSWQYRPRGSRFCTVTRHRRQSWKLVHVDENFAVRFIGHKGSNLSRARDPRLRRERDSRWKAGNLSGWNATPSTLYP